jgi:hypothetical protein
MYAVVSDDQVRQILAMDTAFVLDGHQYPANWLHHADAAAREARQIFPVVQTVRPASRYALVSRTPPVWDATARVVRLGYTLHPVDVAMARCSETDAIEQHGRTLLAHSDQVILAAHDAQHAVPAAWARYRGQIKTEITRLKQALAAAPDEAAIVAVLQSACWPPFPSGEESFKHA